MFLDDNTLIQLFLIDLFVSFQKHKDPHFSFLFTLINFKKTDSINDEINEKICLILYFSMKFTKILEIYKNQYTKSNFKIFCTKWSKLFSTFFHRLQLLLFVRRPIAIFACMNVKYILVCVCKYVSNVLAEFGLVMVRNWYYDIEYIFIAYEYIMIKKMCVYIGASLIANTPQTLFLQKHFTCTYQCVRKCSTLKIAFTFNSFVLQNCDDGS